MNLQSCLLRFAALTLCLSFAFTVHGQDKSAPTKITFTTDMPLDSSHPATIIKKLRQAFALGGIELTVLRVPRSLSIVMANKGIVDGELNRVGNLHEVTAYKYSNLIRIDHKMLSVWVSVFGLREDIRINSLSDIGLYSICYMNGRKLFDEEFAPLVKPGRLMKVDTDRQAFEVLARQEVDVVITTQRVGQDLIASEVEFAKIKEIKKIIELPIYSYIHKKHQGLLPELLENLAKIDPPGEVR